MPLLIGVVEYLSTGGVETNHKDFKELRYNESLTNFSCNGKNGTTNGRITHGFKLKSAYENGLMPYTNYTFDFKVRILLCYSRVPKLFFPEAHLCRCNRHCGLLFTQVCQGEGPYGECTVPLLSRNQGQL